MNILRDIELKEVLLIENELKNFIKIKFGDNIIRFLYESTQREKYWRGNDFNNLFELNILKYVNNAKNFPYNVLLLQLFKNKEQINFNEYYKSKDLIYAYHRSHLGNVLIDFCYKDYLICIQQCESDESNSKMDYYHYYQCDITSRLEKLKNFQLNDVYVNKNNKFIVEYEFLKKYKKYSKADIVKLQINKEVYSLLISKIELKTIIGFIYFIPSKMLFNLQSDNKHSTNEHITFDYGSETLTLPLLPYKIDNLYPLDSTSTNIYSTFINKSITLCISINPFVLLRELDEIRILKHTSPFLDRNYWALPLTEMGYNEDQLSPLLECQLNNLDTQNALAEWKKGNEEAELQHEKFLSSECNNWANLDFEQKMDRDPNRAMDDEEMQAYWAEEDKMKKVYQDECSEKEQGKNEYSYILCGYSKDFLHLEKKTRKENTDYYETIIVGIMPAHFIIKEFKVYTGFIDNSKLVVVFMDEVSKELVQEMYNKLKPKSQFQYIETYTIRLAVEI